MSFVVHDLAPHSESESRLLMDAVHDLPAANAMGVVDELINNLPEIDITAVSPGHESRLALALLSFLAHSYVWTDLHGREHIQSKLAVPWVGLARRVGIPPVLTYSSYILENFRQIEPMPVPVPTFTFSGTPDELWFIRVHQLIENSGGPIVDSLEDVFSSCMARDQDNLLNFVTQIANCIERMCEAAQQMFIKCDPYIYFHRVRRYLHGWRANPLFFDRTMVYQDVPLTELPHGSSFYGESGSQTPLLPIIDALLGVKHSEPFSHFAKEMRPYMYPEHRDLIESVELRTDVLRTEVLEGSSTLLHEYNRALEALRAFRTTHLSFAQAYVVDQAGSDDPQSVEVGTGGSFILDTLRCARSDIETVLAALPRK